MNCKNCGKELKEGTKFCGACGTATVLAPQQEKVLRACPKCGFKTTEDERFCENCGTLLNIDQKPTQKGNLLREYKGYSLYNGRPTVGIAKATGTLNLYDDRVEFKKILGNSVGYMLGAIGMAVSAKGKKKEPVVNYYYRDISKVEIGKYGGIYNTVVIVMQDGSEVTFCPPIPASSQPEEILQIVKLCMQ